MSYKKLWNSAGKRVASDTLLKLEYLCSLSTAFATCTYKIWKMGKRNKIFRTLALLDRSEWTTFNAFANRADPDQAALVRTA